MCSICQENMGGCELQWAFFFIARLWSKIPAEGPRGGRKSVTINSNAELSALEEGLFQNGIVL